MPAFTFQANYANKLHSNAHLGENNFDHSIETVKIHLLVYLGLKLMSDSRRRLVGSVLMRRFWNFDNLSVICYLSCFNLSSSYMKIRAFKCSEFSEKAEILWFDPLLGPCDVTEWAKMKKNGYKWVASWPICPIYLLKRIYAQFTYLEGVCGAIDIW